MTAFPYRRLAYHVDGTQVFLLGPKTVYGLDPVINDDIYLNVNLPEDFEPNALAALNAIDGRSAVIQKARTGLFFLFPVPMRIRGILPCIVGKAGTFDPTLASPVTVEYSQDATELADGTYTSVGAVPQTLAEWLLTPPTSPDSGTVLEADNKAMWNINSGTISAREPNITPDDPDNLIATSTRLAGAGDLSFVSTQTFASGVGGVAPYDLRQVTALRVWFSGNPLERYSNLFLYGDPEEGAWRNYMQVQDMNHHDATLRSLLDWGDAPWDSSADKGIRIKNRSPVMEARDIDIYFDSGFYITEARHNMFVFSLDQGQTWAEKVRLESLSPGATSPVILIRRVTTEADKLGLAQLLLRTQVGEWVDA